MLDNDGIDAGSQGTNLPVEFTFEDHTLRIVTIDGDPWFIATDACKVLTIKDASDAVERLDEDGKGKVSNDTPGGEQTLLAVNEFGLYRLILGSRKPEAKRFKRWVTHEVLPSIRKTGRYERRQDWNPATPRDNGPTQSGAIFRGNNQVGEPILACAIMTIAANWFKYFRRASNQNSGVLTIDEEDAVFSDLARAIHDGQQLATRVIRAHT